MTCIRALTPKAKNIGRVTDTDKAFSAGGAADAMQADWCGPACSRGIVASGKYKQREVSRPALPKVKRPTIEMQEQAAAGLVMEGGTSPDPMDPFWGGPPPHLSRKRKSFSLVLVLLLFCQIRLNRRCGAEELVDGHDLLDVFEPLLVVWRGLGPRIRANYGSSENLPPLPVQGEKLRTPHLIHCRRQRWSPPRTLYLSCPPGRPAAVHLAGTS